MPDLLLETHGSYGSALQNLKLGICESLLQLRCQVIRIFNDTSAFFLEHGNAWHVVILCVCNAQVRKCSCPAAGNNSWWSKEFNRVPALLLLHLHLQLPWIDSKTWKHVFKYLNGKNRTRWVPAAMFVLPATKDEKQVRLPLTPCCFSLAAKSWRENACLWLIKASILRSSSPGWMKCLITSGFVPYNTKVHWHKDCLTGIACWCLILAILPGIPSELVIYITVPNACAHDYLMLS